VYHRAVLLILFLLAVGCGKGTTTSSKSATGDDAPKPTPTIIPTVKPTPSVVDKNEKLESWAMDLVDGDKAESEHAAVELGKVGEPALPYFIKALKSDKNPDKVYVKLNALQQLQKGKDWTKKHSTELAPVLNNALKDIKAEVRREVADTIDILAFTDSIAALRQAVGTEGDAATKRKMEEVLKKIDKK
jgi:HEAT repeat protein